MSATRKYHFVDAQSWLYGNKLHRTHLVHTNLVRLVGGLYSNQPVNIILSVLIRYRRAT